MKRLSSMTAQFAKVGEFSKETFSYAIPGVLSAKRVAHLADEVIPRMIRVRPPNVYAGELENVLLAPIASLASKVILGNRDAIAPGFVSKRFAQLSEIYSVISEVVNTAGSKIVADAFSTELFNASIVSSLLVTDGDDQKPTSVKDIIDKLSSLSDAKLTKMSASLKNSALTPEEAEGTLNMLLRVAGLGKGIPLSPKSRVDAYAKFQDIETAIAMLRSPALIPNSDGEYTAEDYYGDAYALAMAYIVYLHHSSSPDQYDAIFPPAGRMANSLNRIAQVQSAARRSAWFFSGLANATEISDAHHALWLVDNALEFLKPLAPQTSFFKDMEANLATARTALNDTTVAPVQFHTTTIINAISKSAGADYLLPNFMSKIFQIKEVSPRSEVKIPAGWKGYTAGSYERTQIIYSGIQSAFTFLDEIIKTLRMVADVISHRMTSFLSASMDYDANALNIPNELFSIESAIIGAHEPTYSSITRREFLQLSLPRYKTSATNPRKPEFHLKEYTYAAIDLLAMRTRLLAESSGRFIFQPDVTLPLKNNMLGKIYSLPIPYNYASYAHYQSVSNSLMDIESIMKGSDNGMFLGSDFLEDVALQLEMGTASSRSYVASALAGLLSIAVLDAKDKITEITPSIPTIFGVFTPALLANQVKWSEYKEPASADIFRLVPSSNPKIKGYLFRLHTKLPKPGKCVMINAKIDDGVYVAVPLLDSQFATVISTMVTDNQKIDFTDASSFSSKAVIKAAQDVLEPVTGWAPIFQPMPHILFDYQPAMVEEFPTLLTDLQASIQLRMVRKVVAATRSMVIQTTISEDIVVVEPSDLQDLALQEDYAKHDVLEVAMSELDFSTAGNNPKAVTISIKVNEKQASLPVDGAVAAELIRQITSTTVPKGADEQTDDPINTDDAGEFEQLKATIRLANPDLSDDEVEALAKKKKNKNITGDPEELDEK